MSEEKSPFCNEIDLLHPKLPKFKCDDWKVIWIGVLLFFLANTIYMSIGESKQHKKDLERISKLTEVRLQYLERRLNTHYHKFMNKEIKFRKEGE